MNLDRAVLLFAGTLILAGVLLAHFVSSWWLLLVAFVGVNLLVAGSTGFCAAAVMFRKLGLSQGCGLK